MRLHYDPAYSSDQRTLSSGTYIFLRSPVSMIRSGISVRASVYKSSLLPEEDFLPACSSTKYKIECPLTATCSKVRNYRKQESVAASSLLHTYGLMIPSPPLDNKSILRKAEVTKGIIHVWRHLCNPCSSRLVQDFKMVPAYLRIFTHGR